ncbi:glycoside hydrolase 43 family protein (plasmid) [Cellulomonas sp. WB94]|nr:glycoside hydrolase 43 family protein [Cellulomonas sp. WB94]
MDLKNPSIAGFHPDPSVVRVGEDYYVACSTFEYLPGIPVFHSRDLSTWTLIGHVAERVGQLAVEQVPTGGGAWAPTIRYHDGTFWIAITDALGRNTMLFSATDPAGPWSDGVPVEGINGIDPDLAWDEDGTCYMTYSALRLVGDELGTHHGIEQVRIDPHAAKALEEPRSMWSGTGLMFPEAPHLYQRDGWWYLMIAEGGTERGHSVSIARSSRPDGPFEGNPANPILSARSTSRPVQNTGHGDLVRTPDGEWVMVLLGMRTTGGTRAFSPMGRETFSTHVTWVDGWPTAEPVILTAPASGSFEDTFDEAELGGEWIAVRRLPAEVADLTERPGHLVLHGDGTDMSSSRPQFVGFRQAHHRMRWAADVDATAGTGGLTLRYDEAHHYDIEVGDGIIVARGHLASLQQTWCTPAPAPEAPLTLWIETVPVQFSGFENMGSDTVRLGYDGPDGPVALAELDGRYLSAEVTASFTGRVLGVYARDGLIAVDTVRYDGRDD